MISMTGADNLHKIVVLNPKGGCGKTTLATNLASFYAQRGPPPTLIDFDPQGYLSGWLDKRAANRPPIRGIQIESDADGRPIADEIAVRGDSSVVIIDLPAAIAHTRLHGYTYMADSVLLPIVPSEIDIHSATRFIAELLLDVQLDRREQKLAIVANRVRSRTRSYAMLMRFLNSLRIPVIAELRDSQSFVQAAASGTGICELPRYRAHDDLVQIERIVAWLDKRRSVTRKRQALIAQAAYRCAERRGFEGGNPVDDWLEAEKEVDALLDPQQP